MLSAIGSFWLNFYIKKIRAPLIGLTPLQQYIADHSGDSKDENPLLTYFYFLTYEKEVLARKRKQEKQEQEKQEKQEKQKQNAKEAYQEIKDALMGKRKEGEAENTTHKMIVHMLSIVFISTLMISAAAVSTGKLMQVWGESFGAYAYLMQGAFFLMAVAAQWMIYKKTVPEGLKKLLWSKNSWHINKRRELTITPEGLTLEDTTPPNYSKAGLTFFIVCGALLSVSLGMIILDTAAGTVEEGNVFLSMQAINVAAQAFGGVNNFGWFLCISSIACNFALFVSGSINFLFKRADAARLLASEQQAENKQAGNWSWASISATLALVALVALNFVGLSTTVMAQAQSTLKVSLGDSVSPDSMLSLIFNPVFTVVAGICGRGLFNICAMQNLRDLIGRMWHYRSDMWEECKHDVKTNTWTYALLSVCAASVGIVFGLNEVNMFNNAGNILPVVATLGAAIGVYSLFKMGTHYINYSAYEKERKEKPLASPDLATIKTFTLQRDSERRSARDLCMILGNSVGAGALAMSSVSAFMAYSSKEMHSLEVTLAVLAFVGGGLMSMGSALNRVNAEEAKPLNKNALSC